MKRERVHCLRKGDGNPAKDRDLGENDVWSTVQRNERTHCTCWAMLKQ